MQFGCNEINKRIKPSYSGERAICPFCQSELIGKCGEIYAWHWQHVQNSECDLWKEAETEWHRKWKSQFPAEWQEVIIIKNHEKHIADIQTKNGTVIEFQNSSISRATIREREKFYDDMIWIINAEKFKGNLTKFSLVKSKLNDNEKYYSEKKAEYERDFNDTMDRMFSWISDNAQEVLIQENKIHQKDYEILELKKTITYIEEIVLEITNKWAKNEYYYNHNLAEYTSANSALKTEYQSIFNQLVKLNQNLQNTINQLNEINQLQGYYYNEKEYKFTSYERFSDKNFDSIIAIKKGTEDLLIPDVVQFTSVDHFNSFKFQKDRYQFGIEANPVLESKKEQINHLTQKINELELETTKFKIKLREDIGSYINSRITDKENHKNECRNKIRSLKEEQIRIEENNNVGFQKMNEAKEEFYNNEASEQKEKEIKIMQNNKGMYKYWWKNRRPTWDIAENNVFLDFGDDYIYDIINDKLLKRTLKTDFINAHI